MRRVWWFPLYDTRRNVASHVCPSVCKPVHAGLREGRPVIWVEVDPESPEGRLVTCVVRTDWEIVDGLSYAGTYFDGLFVWHVYWRIDPVDRVGGGDDG